MTSNQPYPLALLPVLGDKAIDFLQGYLTCDCTQITDRTPVPWALCNLKGRVVANGWAVCLEPGGIGLILSATLVHQVANMLTPYARFHRCTMDPESACQLTVADLDAVPSDDVITQLAGCVLTRQATDDPVKASQLQTALIQQRFPLVTAPVSEQFLPQVLNLVDSGAVDFNKGCYLGQEIVARAQFRGAVKKQLVSFDWQSQPPQIGQSYTSDELPGPVEMVINCATQPAGTNENNATISGVALGVSRL